MDKPKHQPTPSTPSSMPKPAADLLAAMYAHAPMMVVVMTQDGQVLHCNAATARGTGYSESELTGKNFWALLFPGKLFAQVPRFISSIHPGQMMGKDASLMMRTREGKDRVVAWSHMVHEDASGLKTIVCFGTDLTGRLLDADLEDKPLGAEGGVTIDHGNVGAVEGEVVTPISISPPVLPVESSSTGSAAIQQVHEFLTEIDGRMEALSVAFSQGELGDLAGIAGMLRDGAQACGLLDFSANAERLHVAATCGELGQVNDLVQKIVGMCRDRQPNAW